MTDDLDPRETRTRADRDIAEMQALQRVVVAARLSPGHWADALAEVDVERLTSREALAALPVLRKSDLIAMQEEEPPFGGTALMEAGGFPRLFLSPGPIAEPQPPEGEDPWRFARALRAAGIGEGDVVHNCFSYHLTPAGFMFDLAARSLGAAVFPGGTGQTEAQVQAMRRYRATAYAGTPDFLRTIMERAEEAGVPVEGMTRALVSGGPLFPELREWYDARGIACLQCYGTADVGLIAYETEAREGMVCDEDVLVEIVRPGTGEPVPDGEVGEVVVTTFDERHPMIRFATGDLSAFMEGDDPTGRTNRRLKGWMGRADQTTKVKGMFVHPEAIAKVVAAHPEIAKARLEVTQSEGRDAMRLLCEAEEADGLAERIASTLASEARLKGEVALVAPGLLPNDGKVIDDQRA